ncbi:MAG: M23 family metallopeptidase [Brumimicrobium sp.]|nr:M23 family metallopeptidase [Brumimicrobium sp.]
MVIKKIYLCLTLLFFLIITGFGQKANYKQYNFHPPLDIPLVLSANFGELRTNHFHTGIDFKTQRQTGHPVYSIDNGYVSRVKVSPWGYGHVVYIDHYNGLTSVYAHCEDFSGAIQELVREIQKKQQNFEIDYYPSKDSLKVKKGEIIAVSGNTGGSSAPHLHFEIRETVNEHALNPLLFNFKIADTRKPLIRGVKVYALTQEGYRIEGKSQRINVNDANGKYTISGGKLIVPANYTSEKGGIGFAFDAVDQLNAANNICGIYSAALIVDNDTVFKQEMNTVYFSSNRQINTHKDYEEFHLRRKHFQKTFKTIHNPLPIYKKTVNNGILRFNPGSNHKVTYVCSDVEGNTSELSFLLEISEGAVGETENLYEKGKYLFPDSAYMHFDETHYVLMPPGLLYEPTPLIIDYSQGKLTFGDPEIPLQETFKLMLPIDQKHPKEKYYVERSSKYRQYSETGAVHEGWITVWVRNFGTFEVKTDLSPPVIVRRNFINKGSVRGKTLLWSIDDAESGLTDYDIFIDDRWYLLSWEPKKNVFYFEVPQHLQGLKKLKIRATDACGNSSEEIYELEF